MKLFRKIRDEVWIIYHYEEELEVGDNLLIIEKDEDRGLIALVVEQELINLPGILEDVIRTEMFERSYLIEEYIDEDIKSTLSDVSNIKLAKAKIKMEYRNGELYPWTGWTPTRNSEVTKFSTDELAQKLGIGEKYKIFIGLSLSKEPLNIDARDIQGINIVVGDKGTGKSHLSKTLVLGIIDHGGRVIIFDINNEYSIMRYIKQGDKSIYHEKIYLLEPAASADDVIPLKFTLSYIGMKILIRTMQSVLNLPDTSARRLRNIWLALQETGMDITPEILKATVENSIREPKIADAILRRIEDIDSTGIITSKAEEETRVEEILKEKLRGGGALIINLRGKDRVTTTIVIQVIISKVMELLEGGIEPLFIFAEEAQLYLSNVEWIDLVTRIRHLGAYQFYITNTPSSLLSYAVNMADNIFIFGLTNDSDIQYILPAAKMDSDALSILAKSLPPRRYIAIGSATKNYPIILNTRDLPVKTAGETRRLWI
jgi:hypothetical protein